MTKDVDFVAAGRSIRHTSTSYPALLRQHFKRSVEADSKTLLRSHNGMDQKGEPVVEIAGR